MKVEWSYNMLMCLDVGNTQVHGGIFKNDQLLFQFRKNTSSGLSSDELGIFLRGVLRENKVDPKNIKAVSVCSVVPHIDYSLKSAIRRYFTDKIIFVQPGIKSGLRIKYANPAEVGADRIVTALAAKNMYPGRELLVVDFGTATTVDAISSEGDYLGGAIFSGAKLMGEALGSKTAKLPSVEIVQPEKVCGQSTVKSIQSGLFWSTVGAVKELTKRLTEEVFPNKKPLIVATGGVGKVFSESEIFDHYHPDLALKGLYDVYQKNRDVIN
jgi:type III pantothenate kinase